MKILSIDTSSEACSASLNIDGKLITDFKLAPQQHSSLILPMCEGLLANADVSLNQLDAIAFGIGPGSFTGLRIAAGVVQGMAFGVDLPVIKISTLAALAQQVPQLAKQQQIEISTENTKIIAAIDARMQEVYWCIYELDKNGLVVASMDEAINSPDEITFQHEIIADKLVFGIGTGWAEFSEILSSKTHAPKSKTTFPERLASAEEIGILAANKLKQGDIVSAAEAIPVYLRNNVAKKSQKQFS